MKNDWNLDQYAQHYAETINSPANAWGQHLSPIFGQSHFIMTAAKKCYSSEAVDQAFEKALRKDSQCLVAFVDYITE